MMHHIKNNSRQSYRTSTRNKSTHKAAKNTMTLISNKVFAITFALVLLAGISFKIYKAYHIGIGYDESYTFDHFCDSVHTALTSYVNPNNNHVLNSILICFAHKYFGSYEHFIRIHSILFGILFSLSVAYIIHKTIESKILKIILLGLVLFNWLVFDLSFLARGYSIALGAIYAGIAIISGLLRKKIKYTYRWVPVVVIVLMNFFAFGSMLSCIFVLFSINAIFILFYSPSIFRDAPNRRNPVCLNLISIPSFTFVLLYLLYMNIYKDIWNARNRFATATSFGSHMKQLLVETMIAQGNIFTVIVYSVFVFLTGVSVLFGIYQLWLKAKNGTWRLYLRSDDLCVFIYLVTAITASAMFIHSALLNMSLGYMRNGVFLVPLVLISAGALLDRFWKSLSNIKLPGYFIRGCIVVVTVLLTLQSLPSPHIIKMRGWDQQCISGPLLHRLRDIDPDRIWQIGFSRETSYRIKVPLLYYRHFGYKFRFAHSRDWDVGILYKTEKPTKAIYLDKDYFIKFNCYVVVNPRKAAGLGL